MELRRRLAHALLESHPDEAARVFERLPEEDAVALLRTTAAPLAATLLSRVSPPAAAPRLARLSPTRAASIVAELPLDEAAALLRRLEPGTRDAVVAGVSPDRAESLARLLRYPDSTAGAVMDPLVMALPADISAEEALRRIREHPDYTRYNVYVTDREQRLVGVFNLRELLLAPPRKALSAFANPHVHRIHPDADRHAVVSHPGWRDVHALPVVDADGRYLGAIRYRTLRRLEDAIRGASRDDGDGTSQALGDLFSTALAGLVEAMGSAVGGPARTP